MSHKYEKKINMPNTREDCRIWDVNKMHELYHFTSRVHNNMWTWNADYNIACGLSLRKENTNLRPYFIFILFFASEMTGAETETAKTIHSARDSEKTTRNLISDLKMSFIVYISFIISWLNRIRWHQEHRNTSNVFRQKHGHELMWSEHF